MLDVMLASARSRYCAGAAVGARPPGGRLRIAVSAEDPAAVTRVAVGRPARAPGSETRTLLSELGHEVDERDPAYGLAALEFTQTWMRGDLRGLRSTYRSRAELEPATRQMAAAGRWLVPPRRRDSLRAKRGEATAARDHPPVGRPTCSSTPGLARTALPAEGGFDKAALRAFDIAGRFTPWTPIFNLTGQPAVTVPAGRGADGLPLSVQLVGRRGAEATLYGLAAQIEAARPWTDERPPIATAAGMQYLSSEREAPRANGSPG